MNKEDIINPLELDALCEHLLQENKELKDSITWWSNRFKAIERDNRVLKEKINKAINCINNLDKEDINIYQEDKYWAYILYILKGDD